MTNDQSYTVDEFAKAERLSRSMVYKLWSEGKGPLILPRRICPAHLPRACIEWQIAREEETRGRQ